LTLRGTSPGIADRTVQLTVNVTDVTLGAIVFDYSACPVGERPIWFAIQDGGLGEAWARVIGANDTYRFDMVGKGGIAVVFPPVPPAGHRVTVRWLSHAEIVAAGSVPQCQAAAVVGGLTITGTVANLAADEMVTVSLGGASAVATASAPAFVLNDVEPGPQDLVAARTKLGAVAGGERVIVRRDLDLGDHAVLEELDFTGGESVAMGMGTGEIVFGLNLAPGETITHGMSLFTRIGCTAGPLYTGRPFTGTQFTGYSIPLSIRRPSDWNGITVVATDGVSSFHSTTHFDNDFVGFNRTLDMPRPLDTEAPTAQPGNYKRMSFQNAGHIATFAYVDPATAQSVELLTTIGYLVNVSMVFELPVFSGLPGWDDSWPPAANAQVDWTATASEDRFGGACVDGGALWFQKRWGVF
jgi:hypothetical protein